MSGALSSLSNRQLLSPDQKALKTKDDPATYGDFYRASSAVSTNDINFPKVLGKTDQVGEETLYQVEISNEPLLRKTLRSELASKKKCLTRRWQTALATGLFLAGMIAGIAGLAYYLSVPQTITAPFLLYGESCYMNSRSCDASRLLWCPAGVCLCTGNFQWNSTIENCTCGSYSSFNGFECQGLGYYGDPCTYVQCRPTLTCTAALNTTYTTGQSICVCDNSTYLDTVNNATKGTCVTKLGYNSTCLTEDDCKDWLGLYCIDSTGTPRCECDTSTSYWDSSAGLCQRKVLGWDPCNATVPCDTSKGLTCVAGLCECDAYSYWDNVTTINCQTLKTYGISCQYDFQCNQTVSLSCPAVLTGCSCPIQSQNYICDCQLGNFWDGLRCTPTHSYNGTCDFQNACTTAGNFVCYLGHCICPTGTTWNNATQCV
ncbi:unnamed protein product [Adineta steineri]|uniref:EGF-like domain-containing protein n=1 Tax=Adineta steineri TaxID=433720 RepID=A0A814HUT1_9BILA|nr:unnamed protein product [Adineta steineri]CAF0869474.1 unnamed protein product [Adineta steineri]CAF1014885.1 unnamed protein product [Adineta steineri]